MANLLALIVVHFVLLILYFDIRTIRDERKQFVKLMIAGSVGILIGRSSNNVFGANIDPIFTQSMCLCVASLTSMYLRNLQTETRTSGYLLLLAMFPFILFSVFYLLYYFFSAQILDGILLDYIDFFYSKVAILLFVGSIVYDVIVLFVGKRYVRVIRTSLDGQLGLALFALKLLYLVVGFWQGLQTSLTFGWQLPIFPFGVLVLLLIAGFLCLPRLRFARVYLEVRLHQVSSRGIEREYSKNERLENAQLIDRLIESRKLFRHANLKIADLEYHIQLPIREIEHTIHEGLAPNWEYYLNSKRLRYTLEHLDYTIQSAEDLQRLARSAGFSSGRDFKVTLERELGCSVEHVLTARGFPISGFG
ncbi:MAG: hypothetical protein ACTHZ7_03645 [Sphingobacterium sp.]